jgi:hypothetical protein
MKVTDNIRDIVDRAECIMWLCIKIMMLFGLVFIVAGVIRDGI